MIASSTNIRSLSHMNRVIRGTNGVDGKNKCQHGKNAEHTIIPVSLNAVSYKRPRKSESVTVFNLLVQVPIGTLVRDQLTGEVLAELSQDDQHYVLARGGAGGKGNHFYLSNEARAPTIAEDGGKGEEKELLVEMKIVAHIGKLA